MEREEETYSARETATILRRSKRRILQMVEAGELEASKDEASGQWRVSQRAVHALLDTRPPREKPSQEAEKPSQGAAELQVRVWKLCSVSSDA
jgi:hypothetical protein